MSLPDLIFVSLENWDHIRRRNQFVCAELAKRYPDRKILFVAPPRDVSAWIRTRERSLIDGPTTWSVPSSPNITVTRPLKLLPNSIAIGRSINEALARRHVNRVARQLGLRTPTLWLNPHDAVHMVGRMGEVATVYDITDDWTSFSQSPALTDRIRKQDAALCERADAVIVCSQHLFDLKRSLASNLHLVRNGVDLEHYRGGIDDGTPAPDICNSWAKPVFGYTGTIHGDRLDVPLVAQVADRMDEGSIVLIGPNHLSTDDMSTLEQSGRVHCVDAVPYDVLPQYMKAIDVCFVPHRMTDFTESLDPIKLWEYLAAGMPIVATDIAGFRDFPDVVRTAATTDELINAMQEAVREGDALTDQRRSIADKHSWSARVDAIESILRSVTCPTNRQSSR